MTPDWAAGAVLYGNLEDPQSLNLYTCVENNPVSDTDPDGHYMEAPGDGPQNCGDPCTVSATGGKVSLLNAYGTPWDPSAADLLSLPGRLPGMAAAPFQLWWRGAVDFMLNGRGSGLALMAAGIASALPGDEEGGAVDGAADATGDTASLALAPQRAEDTADYAAANGGAARPGYVGGRIFLSDRRGGGAVLPVTDAASNAVTYREYDVNPYVRGVSRGPERVVVGSDGSAYYTNDHYTTFTKIR